MTFKRISTQTKVSRNQKQNLKTKKTRRTFPSLTRTLSCSGVRLLLVSWRMSAHLHGALHSAKALVSQCAAAAAGFPPGWAVLLWEKARDRDDTAATHQPPPESSTTHRHHLCREQQVYNQTFIHQPFVQVIVSDRCILRIWGTRAISGMFVSVYETILMQTFTPLVKVVPGIYAGIGFSYLLGFFAILYTS